MIVGADDAPLVIVVVGTVFFAGGVLTVSCVASVSGSAGIADVMVVADVGVIGGALTTGGSAELDEDDGCGVDRTAMVAPKRIIPTTATTHVIVARTLFRRGTTTVGLSCAFVCSRFDGGGAASTFAASRPE